MFDHELPGYHLTPNELRMEELDDDRPSRFLTPPQPTAGHHRVPRTGTPGADRTVTPTHRTEPGGSSPSAAGLTPSEAAA